MNEEHIIAMENKVQKIFGGRSPQAKWTEKMQEILISILKNMKLKTDEPWNRRDFLKDLYIKMTLRGYSCKVSEIERKLYELRHIYLEKLENQEFVEPELINIFEKMGDDCEPAVIKVKEKRKEKLNSRKANELRKTLEMRRMRRPTVIWNNGATKALLDLMRIYKPEVGNTLNKKKDMWKAIALELNKRGYKFTVLQATNKWKGMLRTYRLRQEQLKNGSQTPLPKIRYEHAFETYYDLFEYASRKSISSQNDFDGDISLDVDENNYIECDEYGESNDNDLLELSSSSCIENVDNLKTETILCEGNPEQNFEINVIQESIAEEFPPVNEPETKYKSQKNTKYKAHSPNLKTNERSKTEEKSSLNTLVGLTKIANEIGAYRNEALQLEREKLELKRQKLNAYKERTVQISKVEQSLTQLLNHLTRSN